MNDGIHDSVTRVTMYNVIKNYVEEMTNEELIEELLGIMTPDQRRTIVLRYAKNNIEGVMMELDRLMKEDDEPYEELLDFLETAYQQLELIE